MNWTGGRLNRHATSRSGGIVKAQKAHFAQITRKTNVMPDPPRFIANTTLLPFLQPSGRQEECRQVASETSSPEKSSLKAEPRDLVPSTYVRAEVNEFVAVTHEYAARGRDITEETKSNSKPSRSWSNAPTNERTASVSDSCGSIEAMKQTLLRQPDWLGLSACRPARIEYTSVEEMAKIGRRRSVNKYRNRGTKAAPARSNACSDRQELTVGRREKSHQGEDPSTRHTRKETDRNAIHHINPQRVDNRGFDTLRNDSGPEQINPSTLRGNFFGPDLTLFDDNRKFYRLANDETYPNGTVQGLVPLEEVRELASFDSVRNKFLDSAQDRNARSDRQEEKTAGRHRRTILSPTRVLSERLPVSHFGISQSPRPEGRSRRIDGSKKSLTHLENMPTVSTLSVIQASFDSNSYQGDKSQDPRACPSEVERFSSSTVSPFFVHEEAKLAMKDAFSTDLGEKGMLKLFGSETIDYSYEPSQPWPDSTMQSSPRTSSAIYASNMCREDCVLEGFIQSPKQLWAIRPLPRFTLDECRGLDSNSRLKWGQISHLDDQTVHSKCNLLPDQMPPLHFARATLVDAQSDKQDKLTPPQPRSTHCDPIRAASRYFENASRTELVLSRGCRKRSFANAFTDLCGDNSSPAPAIRSGSHTKTLTSYRADNSHATRNAEEALRSSSVAILEQNGTPGAIFSTPPRC